MSLSANVARTQLNNWPKAQVECGAMKPVINSARPMAPVVATAPRASAPAIPVAGSGLAPFRHFFFWPAGGYLRPRAKTRVFHAQGGSGGVWGRKGAVQGPPIDPSNGPIAGLVERDTFFLTPLLGYGGCSKTP